jgi:hypothetical protein
MRFRLAKIILHDTSSHTIRLTNNDIAKSNILIFIRSRYGSTNAYQEAEAYLRQRVYEIRSGGSGGGSSVNPRWE